MQYVISDIHGCSDKFMELLDLIRFSDEDTLYVLGDIIDRGPDSVGLLKYMSMKYNIIPIVGNHEYIMLKLLPSLLKDIEADNCDTILTQGFLQSVRIWFENGGDVTADEFKKLSRDDREFLLEYVEDFELYEEVNVNGRHYFLIHSLPDDFSVNRSLEYPVEQILFGRPDFHGHWEGDITYIIGHTPTFTIGPEYEGKIFKNGNLINIDCGCFAGKTLCAYCLETEEAFYV